VKSKSKRPSFEKKSDDHSHHRMPDQTKVPLSEGFVATELMLRRRREISRKVLAGEWSAEIPTVEELRKERTVWQR